MATEKPGDDKRASRPVRAGSFQPRPHPQKEKVEKKEEAGVVKPDAKVGAESPVKVETKAESKPAVQAAAPVKAASREKKKASSCARDEQVSVKSSRIVLNRIRYLSLVKAKNILEGMVNGTTSVNHKYYTKTCIRILSLLQNAESNAKVKGMDESKLFIAEARADKGRTFYRPRSKNSRSGEQGKMSNIDIVLGER
jgi:ribosomal protein L22